jgi:hypothetical protein
VGAGDEILSVLARIEKKLDTLLAAKAVAAVPGVADDAELDSPKGDVLVRFKPNKYVGPDFKGKKFSQCSAEFLDKYADALQYAAEHPKPNKEKFAQWSAVDAARARGWSRRIRAGWKPPVDEYASDPAPATDDFYDDGPNYNE